VQVNNVEHTGVWAKLYNLRVADHHTYFVGKPEWGFAVWAHNADCAIVETKNGRFEVVDLSVEQGIFTANGLGDAVRFAQQNGHAIRELTVNGQGSPITRAMPIAEQLRYLTNVAPDQQPVLVGQVPLLNGLFPELQTPLPVYRGGETRGVFVCRVPGARVEVPLVSGAAGPGQVFGRTGTALNFQAMQSVKHAEGHAAGLMRAFGITEAELFVNYFNAKRVANDLGGPCDLCRGSIPALLPPKSILGVNYVGQGRTASSGMFIGGESGFHQINPPPANGFSRILLLPRPGE
jgi:hypothetical protein